MASIEVKSSQKGISSVFVDVDGITKQQYRESQEILEQFLERSVQVSDGVADAFIWTINKCPTANPSDIWHHVIYRNLLNLGWSDQRWKRVCGFALERAFVKIYAPRLEKRGIGMRFFGGKEVKGALDDLGISGEVKKSKIDIFLEGENKGKYIVFGGIHIKSSIAERIQDDVPASMSLMKKGLLSLILTMDVKSYPPPHGNGTNYGELGARSWEVKGKDRPKREYIEIDGQFDALFSFNSRTPPSKNKTPSGKRIYTLSLSEEQPDIFVRFVSSFWKEFIRES